MKEDLIIIRRETKKVWFNSQNNVLQDLFESDENISEIGYPMNRMRRNSMIDGTKTTEMMLFVKIIIDSIFQITRSSHQFSEQQRYENVD